MEILYDWLFRGARGFRSFGFGNAESFTEVGVDCVIGFSFTFRGLDPGAQTYVLLFLAVVFTLELVDGFGGGVDGEVS